METNFNLDNLNKDTHQKTGAILRHEMSNLRDREIRNLEAMKQLEKKMKKKLSTFEINNCRVTTTFSKEQSPLLNYIKNEHPKSEIIEIRNIQAEDSTGELQIGTEEI